MSLWRERRTRQSTRKKITRKKQKETEGVDGRNGRGEEKSMKTCYAIKKKDISSTIDVPVKTGDKNHVVPRSFLWLHRNMTQKITIQHEKCKPFFMALDSSDNHIDYTHTNTHTKL